MSEKQMTEELQEMTSVIIPYLDKHPFGKTHSEIYEKLQSEINRDIEKEKVKNALELLETNDEIMNVDGSWRM